MQRNRAKDIPDESSDAGPEAAMLKSRRYDMVLLPSMVKGERYKEPVALAA